MNIEVFYCLYAHFQQVSGFTNMKCETLKKKSYICSLNLMSMQFSISDFAERLKYLLRSKNVSIKVISSSTNIEEERVRKFVEGFDTPSVEEILKIADAMKVSPSSLFMKNDNVLDKLDINIEDFQWCMDNNPSMRGVVIGYLAEYKLREFFTSNPRVSKLFKYDDHDRKRKSDLVVEYNGREITFESKSLQTNTVRDASDIGFEKKAKFQCDASDCRDIELPDGQKVRTTLLKYGDFDILAVNMFAFHGKWEYAFALNKDLPHSTSKKYTPSQQEQLISSLIPITFPIQPPFVSNPFDLLDRIDKEK